jgi:hypothetical protein
MSGNNHNHLFYPVRIIKKKTNKSAGISQYYDIQFTNKCNLLILKFNIICLSMLSTPTIAEELGRLFFTPIQRSQLEINKHVPLILGSDTIPSAPQSDIVREITVNGIVQKNGGSRTTWINGTPRKEGKSDESNTTSVIVEIPDQNKAVRLKVGQHIKLQPSKAPDETQHNINQRAKSFDDTGSAQ